MPSLRDKIFERGRGVRDCVRPRHPASVKTQFFGLAAQKN